MGFWRKRSADHASERIASLEQRLGEVVQSMVRLRDDHDELAYQLKKLRGRFYGEKRHQEAPEEEGAATDTSRMSRDQLKQWLTRSGTFTPGKPAKHSE